ncbi:hypothetical protein [Mycetocola zhujimingii]|uniref:hypothetical protein n=1 Tax=Mycetocola zhujimingii TaxID=2079792 RepID=UPI000D35A958|nr:hypothetical protein [Mycetocola zhujimingii]AWB87686.1 hypothetical protein C3E77_14465 [Mycetocola zhujimingii]
MMKTDNDAWLDQFVLELRLLDVSGADIGDAVATAQEFLADSNQTATDAFGPAREYARSLDLPPVAGARADITRAIMTGIVSLVGFFAVVFAAPAALAGDAVEVRLSQLTLVALALVLLSLAPRLFQLIARVGTWKLVVAGMLLFGLQVALDLTLRHIVLFELPGLPVALVGGGVLLGVALWETIRERGESDPVRAPMEAPVVATGWSRFVSVLPNWILVAAALFFVAVDALLLRGAA